MKHLLTILCLFILSNFWGQSVLQFTPYDDLPCVHQNIKPVYHDSLPEWGKMLYKYPININELINERSKTTLSKNAIERYYKHWYRCVSAYILPDGTIQIPDVNSLHAEQLKLQSTKSPIHAKSDKTWSFIGPKETFWLNENGSPTEPKPCPWQVNVYSLDIAMSNPNIIYAGTETGFVNKSIDKGESWELLALDYFFGGGITAIVVHPNDADIVFVAGGNQIHKSIDGGQTWKAMLGQERFNADRLRIDPTNPNIIFAATSRGIYKSIDEGKTWSRKISTRVWDVRIHPVNTDIVYGVTQKGSHYNVIVSADNGNTFQDMPNFINNIVANDGAMLAISQADPSQLLVILLSHNNTPFLLQGFYDNNTWKWQQLARGRTNHFPMDNGQGYFDLVLEIAPDDPYVIYVGTTTLFRSLDGGNTFEAIGGYFGKFNIHPDIQDIKILPNGNVLVATDGGINISTDHFESEDNYKVSVKGLVGSDFWGFDQGWNEDIIVGGRYHNGNTAIADFYQPKALSMGGAESPTGWVLQGKSRHVAFDDLGNGWILPKKAEDQPEGRFIFSKHPNMDEYGGRRSNIVHHPNYFGRLYLGEGNGLWQSDDSGVNWIMIYTFPGRVRYLTISYADPNILFVDIVDKGIYKTIDGGKQFKLLDKVTANEYGGTFWGGKMHFDISPSNSDNIYVCQQNGTWSEEIGRVLVSKDGGATWSNWTHNVNAYLKSILVQPGSNGEDIVYLFTNAKNTLKATVYYRTETMNKWELLENGYPAGMYVNIAKIFYRDSKLRVAGNAGVWEHPLIDQKFEPILQPWVEKEIYDCVLDTVLLDDHSIIDHLGVSWEWKINPAPEWIDNPFIRNPQIVLGAEGQYDVEMIVYSGDKVYSKKINNMITVKKCPSIEDCTNPAYLPKNEWNLMHVSSQEINYPGLASMSFDGDPNTIWHTRWSTGSDPHPHELHIDLGDNYEVFNFEYLARQEGENGRIKDFELYLSNVKTNWGSPIIKSRFVNTSAPQHVRLGQGAIGRYLKIKVLSEVNNNSWASAAEFSLKGCLDRTSSTSQFRDPKWLFVNPVPTDDYVNIHLPVENVQHIVIFDTNGRISAVTDYNFRDGVCTIKMSDHPSGTYFVTLIDNLQRTYSAKLIKR